MKLSTSIFIITGAFLLASCGLKSKPNLDRTVLEGYNACVVAHKEAQAKELAAWYETQDASDPVAQIYKPGKSDDNCKIKYGISNFQDVSDFRIIN